LAAKLKRTGLVSNFPTRLIRPVSSVGWPFAGNLLTSSNYDDGQKKVTGGRNGYGAKLCNIFSTKFVVETCDM